MKPITKNVLTAVTCVTFGLAGFAATRYMGSHTVSANDPQTELSDQMTARNVSRVVDINLTHMISSEINDALDKDLKLTQEQLDNYAYYAIKYWKEGSLVISLDPQSDVEFSDDNLGNLLKLYHQSKVEPSFEITEDGKVVLTRDLKVPKNYDDVKSSLKEQAEKLVEEWTNENYDENEIFEVKLDVEPILEVTE